jgi:hypothetical protein
MQVTTEHVEQTIRSNCYQVGYLYTTVIVSGIKAPWPKTFRPNAE